MDEESKDLGCVLDNQGIPIEGARLRREYLELQSRLVALEAENEKISSKLRFEMERGDAYMEENERLRELVMEAEEVVEACANTPLGYRDDEVMMSHFYECVFCEAETKDKNHIVHNKDCKILKAQALLPKLREVKGGKP